MTLHDAIQKRFPRPGERGDQLRCAIESACRQFLDDGLGDKNAEQRLGAADDNPFWQQFSEVLVAHQLLAAGITPQHAAQGPDFLFEHAGRRVWVEVICPAAAGLPKEWTARQLNTVVDFPHGDILLRWTSAIKEKANKLLGDPATGARGYLANGVVSSADAYVIAINGRLLRDGLGFPELNGISQLPFAVEATFSVGPMRLQLDPETLRATSTDHQHRPAIPKPNGAAVPADTFLDPRFARVSAVWALDLDEKSLLGGPHAAAVVHNPLASVGLPRFLLPAAFEYVADDYGDHYVLSRLNGRPPKVGLWERFMAFMRQVLRRILCALRRQERRS